MSEYGHLRYETLGQFKERRDPTGRNIYPSPLDGLNYCDADFLEIGKETQGTPNRAQIAAHTGDPSFLALYGNADPTHWARKLTDPKWKGVL